MSKWNTYKENSVGKIDWIATIRIEMNMQEKSIEKEINKTLQRKLFIGRILKLLSQRECNQ